MRESNIRFKQMGDNERFGVSDSSSVRICQRSADEWGQFCEITKKILNKFWTQLLPLNRIKKTTNYKYNMNDQICFGAPWDFGNGHTACASKNIFFTF